MVIVEIKKKFDIGFKIRLQNLQLNILGFVNRPPGMFYLPRVRLFPVKVRDV